MRILILSRDYPSPRNRYAFYFVHTRARNYISQGHHVQVFVPISTLFREIAGQMRPYSVDSVKVCREKSALFNSVLNEFDPDIIAVHGPLGTWYSMLSAVQIPIVIWIHGAEALQTVSHNYYSPFKEDLRRRAVMTIVDSVKALLLRRLLVKSSLVIYVSRWMRQVVEKELLFKNSCSMIIPNSVDTNLFKPPREKIGFHGISIRGLSWKYGVDIAILAYSNLPTQKLTIIGTGPLEHKLRNLACITNSNVDILAQSIDHDELPNFMSKFSYFVSPSRTEAQGVTMCEAMAMGIPPIATTVGGIPEFVVNEENGLLIPPENPLLLRKAVLRLANDEELFERLSQNAISFVHNRLSLDVIGKKEIQVFKFLTNSF